MRPVPTDAWFMQKATSGRCGVVNHESSARFTISSVHESSARFTISSVPAGEAANCRSVGRRIFIDLNEAKNPVRKAEFGDPLDGLF